MFSEEERQIFTYNLKDRKVTADPLALRRNLLRTSAGQFYAWLDLAEEPDIPEGTQGEALALLTASLMSALEHQERILACVREVFGMPALGDGEGYTEAECWLILGEYLDYLEKNGKSGGN